MNLNQQIAANQRSGQSMFIFKEGVKFCHMTDNKQAMLFRVLPDFQRDPSTGQAVGDPSTSWRPFVDDQGQYAQWGLILHISRFIGHGKGGGNTRRDLLSLKTFGQENECPLITLGRTIDSLSSDWGYLVTDQTDPVTKKIVGDRKAFSKPLAHFIMNIYDANKATQGAQVGVFTSSATQSLIDPKEGLIFRRNNLDAEILAKNYLYGYAVGDMTDPNNGPMLMCSKKNDKGEFSGYVVTLATDQRGAVVRSAVTQQLLAGRQDMMRPDSFINIPTAESLIVALTQLLNGRSPNGVHEYYLLRAAFPEANIPTPPSAPGASNTIPVGASFGPPPTSGFMAPVPPPTATSGVTQSPIASAPAQAIPSTPPMGGIPPSQAIPMPTTFPETSIPAGIPGPAGIPSSPTIPGDNVSAQTSSFVNKLMGMAGKKG